MSQEPDKRPNGGPPAAYEAAMAELEQRAARGEMTIAQVKREIFALRERFAAAPEVVLQWATQAHADNRNDTEDAPSNIERLDVEAPCGATPKKALSHG